ncbi:basic secretory family protein [Portibacter marinus]|uniref:basic secretory family protein n=1 Tax=Portibacter marinus TaxID=2898660 RepID=UPI001F47D764|nr:basic secretory family protein [Portibacter marinus]
MKNRSVYPYIDYFLTSYQARLRRFFFFYWSIDSWKRPFSFLEWMCLFLDLLGLPEIYQILHELLNNNVRALDEREQLIAESIFGNRIHWESVRIHDNNTLVCRRMNIAFVSFHTIHFHNCISDGVLIHELVHVWQYEKFGSAYIVRALHAQASDAGYDYGGPVNLTYQTDLLDYNFEQMAEIIKDGFELQGRSSLYNNFIAQLQE